MGASSNRSQNGLLTEINVTPLVDVVLVLLVIMMVTATAIANKSIAIELPKARSGDAGGNKAPLVVSVDEAGTLYLEERRATDLEVRARARETSAKDPGASAVLAADGRARHESVVHALDLLRGERVAKIAIVVRADGDDAAKSPTGDDPGKSPTGDAPGKSPTGDEKRP